MKIGIIGTGNVAWHLSKSLENAGHTITDVYGRSKKSVESMTALLYNAQQWTSLDMREAQAESFLLAISDSAIEEVSQQLQLPEGAILAHTSGAIGLDKLGYAHTPNTGVFYPLQTFSKGKPVDIGEAPICIEGSNKSTEQVLTKVAKSLSKSVHIVNSQQRKSIHLAAVFACNFTNHMFTISQEIMNTNGLDFNLLRPLIAETLNKSMNLGPDKAQTGPAKRRDLETLDNQFKALSNDPDVAEIYRLISQHIIDFYEDSD